MKKKIAFLFVMILCVVLSLALVACNNDKPEEEDKPTTSSFAITQAQVDKAATSLEADANAWVAVNKLPEGSTTDQSVQLKQAITASDSATISVKSGKKSKQYIAAVAVVKNSTAAKYDVTLKWTDDAKTAFTKTFSVNVQYADYGLWAGEAKSENLALTTDTSVPNALKLIINGVINDINNAYKNGKAMVTEADGTLGFTFVGYVEFNYGTARKTDKTAPARYELSINGQVAKTTGATSVAIEAKAAGSSPVFALYYDNAKLYIKAGDWTRYLDKAEIPETIIAIIDYATKDAVANVEEGNDVLLTPIAEDVTFNAWLGKLAGDTVGGVVGALLPSLFNYATSTDAGITTYQLELNLGSLIANLSEVGGIVDGLVSKITPYIEEYIDYADYASYVGISAEKIESLKATVMGITGMKFGELKGIAGSLMLTAKLDAAKNATAVELSLNIPDSDFRWSNADTVAKPYGPLNMAIGVADVSFGEEQTATLPADLNTYKYFSPLNIDTTGAFDIVVDGVATTYAYELYTDVDVFSLVKGIFDYLNGKADAYKAISAEAGIKVTKNGEAFLDAKYTQSNTTLAWKFDGNVYTCDVVAAYKAGEADEFAALLEAIGLKKPEEQPAEVEEEAAAPSIIDQITTVVGLVTDGVYTKVAEGAEFVANTDYYTEADGVYTKAAITAFAANTTYYTKSSILTYDLTGITGENWYDIVAKLDLSEDNLAAVLDVFGLVNTNDISVIVNKLKSSVAVDVKWNYIAEDGTKVPYYVAANISWDITNGKGVLAANWKYGNKFYFLDGVIDLSAWNVTDGVVADASEITVEVSVYSAETAVKPATADNTYEAVLSKIANGYEVNLKADDVNAINVKVTAVTDAEVTTYKAVVTLYEESGDVSGVYTGSITTIANGYRVSLSINETKIFDLDLTAVTAENVTTYQAFLNLVVMDKTYAAKIVITKNADGEWLKVGALFNVDGGNDNGIVLDLTKFSFKYGADYSARNIVVIDTTAATVVEYKDVAAAAGVAFGEIMNFVGSIMDAVIPA